MNRQKLYRKFEILKIWKLTALMVLPSFGQRHKPRKSEKEFSREYEHLFCYSKYELVKSFQQLVLFPSSIAIDQQKTHSFLSHQDKREDSESQNKDVNQVSAPLLNRAVCTARHIARFTAPS